MRYMNRPKITKHTLKELRGELLAKQNTQKRTDNNENDDTVSPASPQASEKDVSLVQEEENEMGL